MKESNSYVDPVYLDHMTCYAKLRKRTNKLRSFSLKENLEKSELENVKLDYSQNNLDKLGE